MFRLGKREILVGVGSNAPDALVRLREARARLRLHPQFRILRSSPLYASDALLPPDAPADWNQPFLNAALWIEVQRLDLQGPSVARKIIGWLKDIEQQMGREGGPKWSPRCIDLDLLDWGGSPVREHSATIPHSELTKRPFAFLPAADCVPSLENLPAAMAWRHAPPEQVPSRTRRASCAWPELVAILNLTPDSFSDGGTHLDLSLIEASARRALAGGATVLDIGAESTRPGAAPVSATEEQARLRPGLELLTSLKPELGLRLSLDSRHASTVEWALAHFPLDWINDVEGFSCPRMLALGRESGCTLVAMHSLGVPPAPERTLAVNENPVTALLDWAGERLRTFTEAGIPFERVILDPGIGFGKTGAQNFALLARAEDWSQFGTRWLVGHSRKRFLSPDSVIPPAERDLETALLSARLACAGPDFLRVHAPEFQARALRIGNML